MSGENLLDNTDPLGEEKRKEEAEGAGEEVKEEKKDFDEVARAGETERDEEKHVEGYEAPPAEGNAFKAEPAIFDLGGMKDDEEAKNPMRLTDSAEAARPPFQLSKEQMAEVTALWEAFQDHTPAYSEIDGYVTAKELHYMMKALLQEASEEYMMELINYVCQNPERITYENFIRICTIRQRDVDIEWELYTALCAFDFSNGKELKADLLMELLTTHGEKLPKKVVEAFIKEVDITGTGTINIDDIMGVCSVEFADAGLTKRDH